MRKTLYLLLTLLFVFSKLPAQQYQLSTFNIYEGFSKGPVKDIEVDELGFIWMATDEGLIRFDGSESRLYKDELKGGFAKALYKTDDSVLYVVHDFGLTRINSFPDTTTFNTLLSGTLLDSDSTIFYPKFILADQDGVLWVGEAAAIVRFSDGRLHKYRFPAKAESDDFFHNFSMIQDESGTLWAMSFTGFLYYLDPVEDRFIECPLDTRINSVAGFIPIGSGRYWVTAGNGIFELSLKKGGNLEYCRQVKSPQNVSCGLLIGQNDFF